MLLVDSFGVWVFLRVVDLPTRTIRARVRLRTPLSMELQRFELSSDRLLLVGKRGAILMLAYPTWSGRSDREDATQPVHSYGRESLTSSAGQSGP